MIRPNALIQRKVPARKGGEIYKTLGINELPYHE